MILTGLQKIKMFSRIYIEEEALVYSRVKEVIEKYKNIPQVVCHHYGEIFNIKNQNFRTQKQFPALIIAIKKGKKILETPEGFGIGGHNNYYFSHMQNCLYDCRYCFLQGMYNSANYLWFVNYEDFITDIIKVDNKNFLEKPCDSKCSTKNKNYFFSGYDCDSLVLESITGFAKEFLPFFSKLNNSIIEFRTKSVNTKIIENSPLTENCLIAFSFTPDEISKEVEHKVPPVRTRIQAIKRLSDLGWKIGLRFDPIIYKENFKSLYNKLIDDIFKDLNTDNLHSVSIGPLRFPKKMHEKISKLYPDENILTDSLIQRGNLISYKKEIEEELKDAIVHKLSNYVTETKIFSCMN